jgi:hypothetical protein
LNDKSTKELVQSNDSKKEKMKSALRETSKLKSWFNPNPTTYIENRDSGREFIADVPLNLIEKQKDPETFEEAYYTLNIEDRGQWRDEISKELQVLKEKEVYQKICKSDC